MRTTNEILTDIYRIIKDSPIDALNGGIYKQTRPTDSKLQDCVISLITGNTAKFLQGAGLYVKLFYPDINSNNTYSEDLVIGSQMQNLLFDLSNTLLKTPGYSFQIQTREIYSEAVEQINEHYAILKINFRSLL